MKPRSPTRAKLHLIFFAVLLFATLNLISIPRSQNVCTALKSAHRELLHTIHSLPRNISKSQVSTAKPLHDQFRRSSTAFLSIASLPQVRHCRPLRPKRSKLEFLLLHSKFEPVLLYLLSITGARKKTIVSVDAASGLGYLAGSVEALLHGWRVIAICQKWSGFEATRKFYEGTGANVVVVDASSSAGRTKLSTKHTITIDPYVAREAVGGVIDALILFPEQGDELSIIRRIRQSSLRPRIIALFFQAYWGTASRYRTGEGMVDDEGRERLFVGGSLPALLTLAKRVEYRLVWCMTDIPIAFFVDERAGVAFGVLPDVRVEQCFGKGLTWQRDAEAMWDVAQDYKWETVT